MKNDEKRKMWKGLVVGLCISTLTGCSMAEDEKTGSGDVHPAEQSLSDGSETEDIYSDESSFSPDENGPSAEEKGTEGAGDMSENRNDTMADESGGEVDANDLYASAAVTGSVVDFSDEGCTVSAAVTEDDGKTGVIAAPGSESEDTNVAVAYREGCEVWIATIHTSTGTAELEQASVTDIKKQASVIVYGSFEDAHHLSAVKIIICHRTT